LIYLSSLQYVFCRICLEGYHVGECESQMSETSVNVFSSKNYSVDLIKANEVS